MEKQRDLSFWKLWNLSFGFFGVQIAYALQSSQVSRIFATIGADPHDLSYFWILPPLMGMIVQPIVGTASDRTWNRLGRRLPYLLVGALIAMVVMCFLPNAGSLGLGISQAIIFGLVMLMLLDTTINMAMQPFKMLVGDMVNEKQKGFAYSIQSFLCNAGSVVGYLAPLCLAFFLSNTAPAGEVPPTVTWAFYIGAIILLACVVYTFATVKEMPPAEYAAFHGVKSEPDDKKQKSGGLIRILASAPKVFWTVGLVQFFCWAAFMYMWVYSTEAIANQAYDTPTVERVEGVTIDGQKYNDKFLFDGKMPVIQDGALALAGVKVDGAFSSPSLVVLNGDTLIAGGKVVADNGTPRIASHQGVRALEASDVLTVDGVKVDGASRLETVSRFAMVEPGTKLTLAHIARFDEGSGEYLLDETTELPAASAETMTINYHKVLNVASAEYQSAGNETGLLFAIQGLVAVLWALVLPMFRKRKLAYSLSLLIGGIGFASIFFSHNIILLGVGYGLAGCAWAAMLAMPFTILTNALSGNNIGTYLGLFNCTICLPQIIASLLGGLILSLIPVTSLGVPNAPAMLLVSGILLCLGALAVWGIRETFGSQSK